MEREKPLNEWDNPSGLHFRLDEMNFNMHVEPMILTMKIQVPDGNIKSVNMEVVPEQKEYIFWRTIDKIMGTHLVCNKESIELLSISTVYGVGDKTNGALSI